MFYLGGHLRLELSCSVVYMQYFIYLYIFANPRVHARSSKIMGINWRHNNLHEEVKGMGFSVTCLLNHFQGLGLLKNVIMYVSSPVIS
jgi:hypothetical protein